MRAAACVSGLSRAAYLVALLLPAMANAQSARRLPVDLRGLSGAIAGRVCRDLNSDGVCQQEEPRLPGVRLVLETGQEVRTDERGRYHFAQIRSRISDTTGGPDLLPGRHRIRADPRGLLPGAKVVPQAVTVEVPVVGLVLQNFAVQERAPAAEVEVTSRGVPPTAALTPERRVLFLVTGRATPGETVFVDGVRAETSAQGVYRASVPLGPGSNEVSVKLISPEGAVRLYAQQIDVVPRPNGALVIPREPRPTARVRLPGSTSEPASAGAGRVRVEGPAGSTVGHPGGQVVIGEEGAIDVPVELTPGTNVLPLRIQRPGEAAREERLEIEARARPFVVALLDVEVASVTTRTEAGSAQGLQLLGRGAAHGEVPFGRFLLQGEVDVRDQDVEDVRSFGIGVLAAPRDVLALERAVDPEETPLVYADESSSVVPNEAGGRVRLELSHPELGALGFGTYRAQFAGSEFGRYHRELFGPWVRVGTDPKAALSVRAQGFASNGATDPVSGISTRPAHVEFLPTGGSLFYLPHAFVSRGSERVRVVVRDGLTSVPIAETHLIRGVDYELDAQSGRILLAQPLSFALAPPQLATELPTMGAEPVLVVDYEYTDFGAANRAAAGGEARATLGPVTLSAGGVGEGVSDERYRLIRAGASVKLFGLLLSAEAAQSSGRAHLPDDVAISSSGGLDFITPDEAPSWSGANANGWALGVRLRGETFAGGRIDASWRRRTPSFSDESWDARGPLAQLSATVEQPVGPVVVGVIGDGRTAVDPRDPFGRTEIATRTLGGYVAYRAESFEARVEAKDSDVTLDARASEEERVQGGRTSVGASARYKVAPWLWVSAGHRQAISSRGEGPGAFNDSFSSVGADITVNERTQLGVRGGWGPKMGALAWATGKYAKGPHTYYGSYSVDPDGPDFGERKAVTGARTTLNDGSAIFVEDVGAHDATSVRLARAVGASYALAPGLVVTARYERGVKSPIDVVAPLRRDAGGLSASWVRERVKLYGRAETRFERGRDVLAPLSIATAVDRVQRVASAAGSVEVLSNLEVGGRLNWSDTHQHERLVARLLEGSAGVAWRIDPAMVLVHYGVERELSPVRATVGERVEQRISVMPSVKVGDRFAVAGGAHLGWYKDAAEEGTVLSASIRPSVRVVAGLEVAAEVARRSLAPDGESLDALRGEVGYRFGEDLLLAGGYTLYGYSGLGLSPTDGDSQRAYLRAEAAW